MFLRRILGSSSRRSGCLGGLQRTTTENGSDGQVEPSDTTQRASSGPSETIWNLPYGKPGRLDPAFSSSESNSTVIANLRESLLLMERDFTGSPNLATVKNEEFDELVIEAHRTLDDDAQADPITEAQTNYAENLVNFLIVSQYVRPFMAEGVTGATVSQAFCYSPWAARVGCC